MISKAVTSFLEAESIQTKALATLCRAVGFFQSELVYCCTSLQSAVEAGIETAMTGWSNLKPPGTLRIGDKNFKNFQWIKKCVFYFVLMKILFSAQIHLFIWDFFFSKNVSASVLTATNLEAELWCFAKWALVSAAGNWGTSWFSIQASPPSQEQSPVIRLQIRSAQSSSIFYTT